MSAPTAAELWDLYAADLFLQRSPRTIRNIRSALESFWLSIAPKHPLSANRDDLEAFLDQSAWADHTRLGYSSQIGGFYRWAVTKRLIAADPMAESVITSPLFPYRVLCPLCGRVVVVHVVQRPRRTHSGQLLPGLLELVQHRRGDDITTVCTPPRQDG